MVKNQKKKNEPIINRKLITERISDLHKIIYAFASENNLTDYETIVCLRHVLGVIENGFYSHWQQITQEIMQESQTNISEKDAKEMFKNMV